MRAQGRASLYRSIPATYTRKTGDHPILDRLHVHAKDTLVDTIYGNVVPTAGPILPPVDGGKGSSQGTSERPLQPFGVVARRLVFRHRVAGPQTFIQAGASHGLRHGGEVELAPMWAPYPAEIVADLHRVIEDAPLHPLFKKLSNVRLLREGGM